MQPGPGLFLSGNDLQVCRRVDVLPELAASLHHSKLPTVQFHRNGAVRITLKNTASCNDVALKGIKFRGASSQTPVSGVKVSFSLPPRPPVRCP